MIGDASAGCLQALGRDLIGQGKHPLRLHLHGSALGSVGRDGAAESDEAALDIDVATFDGPARLDGADSREGTFRFEIDASVTFDESRGFYPARIRQGRGSGGNAARGKISHALRRDHAAFVFDSGCDGTDRHLDIKESTGGRDDDFGSGRQGDGTASDGARVVDGRSDDGYEFLSIQSTSILDLGTRPGEAQAI